MAKPVSEAEQIFPFRPQVSQGKQITPMYDVIMYLMYYGDRFFALSFQMVSLSR